MSTPVRLLLVEDDRLIRETLVAVLEDDGFNVVVACDGAEAAQRIEEAVPDVVLSDIRMPRMNGTELLERMRQIPGGKDVPYVFVSALASEMDVRGGMNLGADDYITKPFDPVQVCRSLRARLRRVREMQDFSRRQEAFLARYLPHELRTPLNGVLGFSELMADFAAEGQGLSPEETGEYGKCIAASGERLLAVADNLALLHDLGRQLERGALPVACTASDQWAATTRTVSERTAEAHGRSADLTVDIIPASLSLPTAPLPRVIGLLVDNACKFSRPGSRVTVSGRSDAASYRLLVADLGRGMTTEEIKAAGLFRQFDRDRYEQQGLGLGLEIARRYARVARATFVLQPNVDGPGLTAGLAFHGLDCAKA
jgi:two-component system sensor histidine kinase/response regulator